MAKRKNITIKEEKMKSYKLVASDLDGTLLNREKRISRENKEAIGEMASLGVHFVASSGRCLREMPCEIMENPHIHFISCSDGAVVYDKNTLSPLVKNYMPREVVSKCVDILKDYEIVSMTHVDGKLFIDENDCNHENYLYNNVTFGFEELMCSLGTRVEDCLEESRRTDLLELFCVFFHSPDERNECIKRLLDLGDVKIASSEKNNLEIYYKKAGKGNALISLAEHLAIDIEQVIAVGDSLNDVEMVKEAGLGLAVSNATAELLEIADRVICSNEEHAAKYILENLIK